MSAKNLAEFAKIEVQKFPMMYFKNKIYVKFFRYETSANLESLPMTTGLRTYSGGGYIFRFTGPTEKLEAKIDSLIETPWVDNRTRALILEFSVYNAQVIFV